MSRDRGLRLQNALAEYLRQWWPAAESAGSGRNGSDILGTPGVVWECKAPREFSPLAFVRQAQQHAATPKTGGDRCILCGLGGAMECPHTDIPVVVYWPTGVGARSAEHTLAIVPLGRLAQLLKEAGYA